MPNSIPLNFNRSQANTVVGGTLDPASLVLQGSRAVSDEKDEKLPRNKRTNIPKTVIINSKTREVIDPVLSARGEGNEHVEDKDIVQRLNRLLIEG